MLSIHLIFEQRRPLQKPGFKLRRIARYSENIFINLTELFGTRVEMIHRGREGIAELFVVILVCVEMAPKRFHIFGDIFCSLFNFERLEAV